MLYDPEVDRKALRKECRLSVVRARNSFRSASLLIDEGVKFCRESEELGLEEPDVERAQEDLGEIIKSLNEFIGTSTDEEDIH